jgi:hypothetical protein
MLRVVVGDAQRAALVEKGGDERVRRHAAAAEVVVVDLYFRLGRCPARRLAATNGSGTGAAAARTLHLGQRGWRNECSRAVCARVIWERAICERVPDKRHFAG